MLIRSLAIATYLASVPQLARGNPCLITRLTPSKSKPTLEGPS